MEKLKVVMAPDLTTNYGPNHFLRRRIMWGLIRKKNVWLGCMVWVPWWNFSDVCSRSFYTYLALAGLIQCSFYHPLRIVRQQGLKQHLTHRPYLPNIGALTKSFIEAITQSWTRKIMLHHIYRNQEFSTTQEYNNWLKGHNKVSGSSESSSRG